MSTLLIVVGNSDNKLSQIDWSDFVGDIRNAIEKTDATVHFFGGASTWEQWQNVAWVIDAKQESIDWLLFHIKEIRERHQQDSAFVMIGDGMFI